MLGEKNVIGKKCMRGLKLQALIFFSLSTSRE